jgi:hypothetical protein
VGEESEQVVRESALAERERHDREKAEANRARQIRLGDVPDSSAEEEAPKPKARAKPKPAAKSE